MHNTPVFNQIHIQFEANMAHLTSVRTRMYPQMFNFLFGRFESFTTLIAFVRFHIAMRFDVAQHMIGPIEFFITEFTFVPLLVGVDGHMAFLMLQS